MIKDYLCLNLCIAKSDVTKRQIVLSPFKTIEIFLENACTLYHQVTKMFFGN